MLLVGFAVNMGNLGRAPSPRFPMAELVRDLDTTFRAQGRRIRVLDFFGHTGNFLLESAAQPIHVGEALGRLLRTPCAVVPIGKVASCAAAVQKLPPPRAEPAQRWTPGVVFHVCGASLSAVSADTCGARFQRMDDCTILAWKRDQEDSRGRLDKKRRRGGWGAVSSAVAQQLGGTWTARSASTLDGVLMRIEATGGHETA